MSVVQLRFCRRAGLMANLVEKISINKSSVVIYDKGKKYFAPQYVQQLAVEAFAQALEIIPAALAENSGLDPLDTLISLRQLHSDAAGHSFGVDVENGGGVNMLENGIVEPINVVSQALDSATTIAAQLLRIDNIIEMRTGPEIGEDGFQY